MDVEWVVIVGLGLITALFLLALVKLAYSIGRFRGYREGKADERRRHIR